MRLTIDSKRALLYTPSFPSLWRSSSKRYRVLVGIGSNLGNKKRIFDRLFLRLQSDSDIDLIKSSPIFINPDFASDTTPSFFNAVALIATDLSPKPLLRKLNYLESRFGRVRSYKNAPRTLDLDIIFYETKSLYNEKLYIPHPYWCKRSSVLVPMINLNKL